MISKLKYDERLYTQRELLEEYLKNYPADWKPDKKDFSDWTEKLISEKGATIVLQSDEGYTAEDEISQMAENNIEQKIIKRLKEEYALKFPGNENSKKRHKYYKSEEFKETVKEEIEKENFDSEVISIYLKEREKFLEFDHVIYLYNHERELAEIKKEFPILNETIESVLLPYEIMILLACIKDINILDIIEKCKYVISEKYDRYLVDTNKMSNYFIVNLLIELVLNSMGTSQNEVIFKGKDYKVELIDKIIENMFLNNDAEGYFEKGEKSQFIYSDADDEIVLKRMENEKGYIYSLGISRFRFSSLGLLSSKNQGGFSDLFENGISHNFVIGDEKSKYHNYFENILNSGHFLDKELEEKLEEEALDHEINVYPDIVSLGKCNEHPKYYLLPYIKNYSTEKDESIKIFYCDKCKEFFTFDSEIKNVIEHPRDYPVIKFVHKKLTVKIYNGLNCHFSDEPLEYGVYYTDCKYHNNHKLHLVAKLENDYPEGTIYYCEDCDEYIASDKILKYNTLKYRRIIDFINADIQSKPIVEQSFPNDKSQSLPSVVYVYYKLTNTCTSNKHDVEALTLRINNIKNDSRVSVNVYYCKSCGKYFINYEALETLFKKNIVPEFKYKVVNDSWSDLKPVSELMLYGYTVKEGEMSDKERHELLIKLIEKGLLNKQYIINNIQSKISFNGKKKANENARKRWEDDIKFLSHYTEDNTKELKSKIIFTRR